jgi:hypothetical protein
MRAEKHSELAGLMLVMAIATSAGCHRADRSPTVVGPAPPPPLAGRITVVSGFHSRSSVRMACPSEAPSKGPVPVWVEFAANRRTYWDTNGITDEALHVLFVRVDRPDIAAIAKIPPGGYMLPNRPLQGRPSDKELDDPTHRVVQTENYDLLAYGRTHPGSADYFAVATFSDAWHGPIKVRITSPAGPEPADPFDFERKSAGLWYGPGPSERGVVASLAWVEGRVAVVGTFRVAATSDPDVPAPFLSVGITKLRTTGGVIAGQLWVPWGRDKDDWVGSFTVPVRNLRMASGAELERGNYALFAFVGYEAAPVQVFKVE